jgi:hypothetical protein
MAQWATQKYMHNQRHSSCTHYASGALVRNPNRMTNLNSSQLHLEGGVECVLAHLMAPPPRQNIKAAGETLKMNTRILIVL